MPIVPIKHICVDEEGVAWIHNANIKVVEVALDMLAYDMTPEDLSLEYPTLSLAQIHAALSFYYDHQQEIDREIEMRFKEVEKLAEEESDPILRERLHLLLESAVDFI